MALDFSRVAAAALAQAETLCQSWLGGKRSGHEWLGERRANGGLGDSWSVNLNSGAWGHFGSDEKGGDLISLYAALNHTTQLAALEVVAKLVGVTNGAAGHPVLRVVREERPAEPIPTDAPPVPDHRVHGIASALYRYGDAFVVARYELPAGKQFCPWTWRAGKWTPRAYPAPRPLYGLSELSERPDEPVLVVEGEKCHEAAARALTGYVCVTWAGGAQSVKTADWEPLTGRDVLLWPDADDVGRKCMAILAGQLLPIVERIRIIKTDDQSEGWDLADAEQQGWSSERIAEWIEAKAATVNVQQKQLSAPAAPVMSLSVVAQWEAWGLTQTGRCAKSVPYANAGNVATILKLDKAIGYAVWFDDFRGRIYLTLRNGTSRPWTDADDIALFNYVQIQLHLPKLSLQTVNHAVQIVAFSNRRNSVIEYLESLIWDGTERLSNWVSDYLGCPNTEYTQAVGRNWLISMVARAYKPGCQVDHMPVLEGASGRGKSSALAILGGEWYRAAPQAFGSKEFFEVIQGAWLVEIPDMVGFGRREHSQIISAITTRSDSYRASYGRHAEDHQRTVIFAATSETDDYLQDSRGIRRYWPLRCSEIDLTLIEVMRGQLLAEAVKAFKKGAAWHEMPALETHEEQARRQEMDPWLERISERVNDPSAPHDHLGSYFSVRDIAENALHLEYSKQDRSMQLRITKCLKSLGLLEKPEWRKGGTVRIYRKK